MRHLLLISLLLALLSNTQASNRAPGIRVDLKDGRIIRAQYMRYAGDTLQLGNADMTCSIALSDVQSFQAQCASDLSTSTLKLADEKKKIADLNRKLKNREKQLQNDLTRAREQLDLARKHLETLQKESATHARNFRLLEDKYFRQVELARVERSRASRAYDSAVLAHQMALKATQENSKKQIRLGSTMDEVRDAYGKPTTVLEQDLNFLGATEVWQYTTDDGTLGLTFRNGILTNISIGSHVPKDDKSESSR